MRQFGLIGYPLSHSFSKGFFAEKFLKENIVDAQYENYPIATIEAFKGLDAVLKLGIFKLLYVIFETHSIYLYLNIFNFKVIKYLIL